MSPSALGTNWGCFAGARVRRLYPCLFASFLSLIVPLRSHAETPLHLDHRDKLYDIFVDGQKVWVVGSPGRLLFSPDAGTSFEARATGTRDALMAIDFGDKQHGLIVGRARYALRTRDGGDSWTKASMDVDEPIFDVDMVGSSHAWAVGHFNTILHTKDGGASWQPQHYEVPEDALGSPGLHAVSFVDETHGWIVGEFGTVLCTQDGGASWRAQPSGTDLNLYAVHFSTRRSGIAAGALGTVLRTEDGGHSWVKLDSNTERALFSLHWTDRDLLFAVGDDGCFVGGALGSQPFTPRPIEIYTWLSSVHFFNPREGIVVGGRGHILTTDNGGKSWTKRFGK